MGTNYYWHDDPCPTCNRRDVVHVGKKSAGWSFLFRAWPHVNPQYPEWDHLAESPFGRPVLSRDDWRWVFTYRPGRLFNEYGDEIDDPTGWLDSWEPPDGEQCDKETAWLAEGTYVRPVVRDSEGFRFYADEFS
jgi:hypothetical protein